MSDYDHHNSEASSNKEPSRSHHHAQSVPGSTPQNDDRLGGFRTRGSSPDVDIHASPESVQPSQIHQSGTALPTQQLPPYQQHHYYSHPLWDQMPRSQQHALPSTQQTAPTFVSVATGQLDIHNSHSNILPVANASQNALQHTQPTQDTASSMPSSALPGKTERRTTTSSSEEYASYASMPSNFRPSGSNYRIVDRREDAQQMSDEERVHVRQPPLEEYHKPQRISTNEKHGMHSGTHWLGYFDPQRDDVAVTKCPLEIPRARGCPGRGRQHAWPNYPDYKAIIPAGKSLSEICREFPNHVWGEMLRIFIAEGWAARRIFDNFPEDVRRSCENGPGKKKKTVDERPHNFLQAAMGREIDIMSNEDNVYRRIIRNPNKGKKARVPPGDLKRPRANSDGSDGSDNDDDYSRSKKRRETSSSSVGNSTQRSGPNDLPAGDRNGPVNRGIATDQEASRSTSTGVPLTQPHAATRLSYPEMEPVFGPGVAGHHQPFPLQQPFGSAFHAGPPALTGPYGHVHPGYQLVPGTWRPPIYRDTRLPLIGDIVAHHQDQQLLMQHQSMEPAHAPPGLFVPANQGQPSSSHTNPGLFTNSGVFTNQRSDSRPEVGRQVTADPPRGTQPSSAQTLDPRLAYYDRLNGHGDHESDRPDRA